MVQWVQAGGRTFEGAGVRALDCAIELHITRPWTGPPPPHTVFFFWRTVADQCVIHTGFGICPDGIFDTELCSVDRSDTSNLCVGIF